MTTTEITVTSSEATSVQHLNLAPEEANEELSMRLRSASNSRVNFAREAGRLTLSLAKNASPSDLRYALRGIDDAMIAGPAAEVMAGLTMLVAVTRRPSYINEQSAALYFKGIAEAMMEYPIDVVKAALKAWRKGTQGEWWPAEAEIRRVCDKMAAERRAMRAEVEMALRNAEAEAQRIRPSSGHQGPAAEFMQRARARATKGVNLTFFDKHSMRIEGGVIWVRAPIQETVVKRIAGDIADELGFEIRRCTKIPSSFPPDDSPPAPQHVRDQTHASLLRLSRGLLAEKPRSVSHVDWARQMREMATHAATEKPA